MAWVSFGWVPKLRADTLMSGSIPAEAPKAALAESQPLPLPYAADDREGALAPAAPPAVQADVPPPLARPLEHRRRPFELSASLAAALPSCQPGSIDDRRCGTIDPGTSWDAALLYRVNPYFGVGAEAAFAGFAQGGVGGFSSMSSAKFVGLLGRVYFAESGLWDPYLSLTLGGGSLTARVLDEPQGRREGSSGIGGRIGAGLDVLLGSRIRLGPAASFAHWVAWSEQRCKGEVCQTGGLAYGRLLGFATLGLRLTLSLGEAL